MNAQPGKRSLEEVAPLRVAESPAEAFEEAEVEAPAAPVAPTPEPAPAKPRRGRRRLLIAALPLALAVVGGYLWATGGRFVGTEDAYVKQDRVSVMPQVSGQIASVGVAENDTVKAGQLLFTIDDSAYRSAVEEDRARLQQARLEVEKLKAAYQQALSEEATARDALATAQTRDDRQQTLLKSGVVPQATADDSALALQQAKGALAQAESGVLSAKAALAGNPDIPIDQHPEVLQALAALHAAELDLSHTVVTAPLDGVISQTDRLQQGQYVTPSTAVLSLVETDRSWIEANYKETDLTHMRPGQPVEVTVDTYPDRTFTGEIGSIGAGTGSEFALLPAQNASGNWVKVVQRVPLRVTLDPGQNLPPLRSGMSASVEADTGHPRGLPKFIAGPLAAIGLGGHTAVAAPADAAK
jgi:membrane fusion protein (multidrug efflux system)